VKIGFSLPCNYLTGSESDGCQTDGSFFGEVKTFLNKYPAGDYFVLESSSAVQLDLYSGNGEKIISKQGVVRERVDVSGLKPGTYLLKVTDEKTRLSTTRKMIIQ